MILSNFLLSANSIIADSEPFRLYSYHTFCVPIDFELEVSKRLASPNCQFTGAIAEGIELRSLYRVGTAIEKIRISETVNCKSDTVKFHLGSIGQVSWEMSLPPAGIAESILIEWLLPVRPISTVKFFNFTAIVESDEPSNTSLVINYVNETTNSELHMVIRRAIGRVTSYRYLDESLDVFIQKKDVNAALSFIDKASRIDPQIAIYFEPHRSSISEEILKNALTKFAARGIL